MNQSPLHRYTLRGVSTTKYITYLRRQAEPDLIEMDLDANESNPMDQWWKVEWAPTELKPILITVSQYPLVMPSITLLVG